MTGTLADKIYDNLSTLRTHLPTVRSAIIPGTPRRWQQRDLTDEQRDRINDAARAERADRAFNDANNIPTLGESRAPLRLDVLGDLIEIEAAVVEMEDAVCEHFGITPLVGATTAERITRLIGLLDRITVDDELAGHVHDEARRMARKAARAIGDTEQVNRLEARCPICSSLSLRAFPEREIVACVNPACRCAALGCPCQDERRPQRHRWPFDQWPWLAQVLADELVA